MLTGGTIQCHPDVPLPKLTRAFSVVWAEPWKALRAEIGKLVLEIL